MLYSNYYLNRVSRKPTTQADQLADFLARKSGAADEASATKVEAKDEDSVDPVSASATLDSRIAELTANNTVTQLKAIAQEYGLTIPSRSKEAAIAKLIANHEKENPDVRNASTNGEG